MSVKLKCVILGTGAIGKTSLYFRYARNQFPTEYVPTVFDNCSLDREYNGTQVELGLWDTAGGEDYHRLRPLCYPNTDFFLICFAVDDRDSLRCVEEEFYPEVAHFCPDALKFLICTKIDLRAQDGTYGEEGPKRNIISYEEGSDLATKLNFKAYIECSSLTGEGVSKLFKKAVEEALNHPIVKKKKKTKCLLL